MQNDRLGEYLMKLRNSRAALSFLVLLAFVTLSVPQIGYSQSTAVRTEQGADLSAQLAAIENQVEARRKELGIPGMSLAIVKDDKVVYLKGLGLKDFEKKVAVTPDTQFAIGSATKAFTALSVLMSQDQGKLSLDDSPKKYLPYFKMFDPDADKNILIRDLLSHSSGLNRTDLAMITGRLNRSELIQVAAQAKPTAKLREKFQYQNIMFAAAGEIVVGPALERSRGLARNNGISFRSYSGKLHTFVVADVLPQASELVSADLVLMNEESFRAFFDYPAGHYTDIALTVANPLEVRNVALKLAAALPDARPILRDEVLRTYASIFDWREGIVLALLSAAILAFGILAWDKASGLSAEERREIGILKAIGWETDRKSTRLNSSH